MLSARDAYLLQMQVPPAPQTKQSLTQSLGPGARIPKAEKTPASICLDRRQLRKVNRGAEFCTKGFGTHIYTHMNKTKTEVLSGDVHSSVLYVSDI